MSPPAGFLDDAFIETKCPKCSYPVEVQLVDARTERLIFCPNCKIGIQLVDDAASMEVGLRKMEDAIRHLGDGF